MDESIGESSGSLDVLLDRLDESGWPWIEVGITKRNGMYEVEVEISGKLNGVALSRKGNSRAAAVSEIVKFLAATHRISESTSS